MLRFVRLPSAFCLLLYPCLLPSASASALRLCLLPSASCPLPSASASCPLPSALCPPHHSRRPEAATR